MPAIRSSKALSSSDAVGVGADSAFATLGAGASSRRSSTIRGGFIRIISFSRRPSWDRRTRAVDRGPFGSTSTCSIRAFFFEMERGMEDASRETISSATSIDGSERSMR